METLKIRGLSDFIRENERLKPNLSTDSRFGGGYAECPKHKPVSFKFQMNLEFVLTWLKPIRAVFFATRRWCDRNGDLNPIGS